MEFFKEFVNTVSAPQIMFPFILAVFFFIFPPSDRMAAVNRRLGLYKIWTNKGGIILFSFIFLFFAISFPDPNFHKIVTKPDNVPIVGLIFLVIFFLWLSMKQAYANDARIAEGKPPAEAEDAKQKILVWPDLVYIEFIALIAVAALLIIWAIVLKAPLEEAANPTVSPNPSKAPWYFLGLQEMLVYYDPWIAGVLFPTVIMLGFMCIPFLDTNRKGSGYYTFKDRRVAVSIFLFFWLVLWIFLILTGTFLRGPNWNFFGPFEYWDPHKIAALTNVNLSEVIYMIWFNRSLPHNIFLREIGGIVVILLYFGTLPVILAKTIFKNIYARLGLVRYSIFIVFLLIAISLPIKMFLRWSFNIKYILSIPEFFFNI